MNNLPAKENQFVRYGRKWTEYEIKAIEADEQGRAIKRYPKLDCEKMLVICIRKGYQILGHEKDISDSKVLTMARDVYQHVKKNYPNAKLEELCLAIEMGCFGEYGEDFSYMSAKSIVKWLKIYLNRKQILSIALTTAKEKEALKTTKNESKEKVVAYWDRFPEMVETEFKYWRDNWELSESADRICAGLEKIGFKANNNGFLGNVIDAHMKKVWWKEASEKEKYRIGAYDVNRFKDKVELVYKEAVPDGFGDKIKSICFRKSLQYWFKTLQEIDKEGISISVNDYLNDQRKENTNSSTGFR